MGPSDPRPTVGFDIGGTHCRAAVVTAGGEVVDTRSTATPTTVAALEDAIVTMVGELRADHDPAAVGLAVAGFLDPACETVRFAPHLPWRDAPVRARLEELTGLPVTLEHDANAAAWGEYRHGAARGAGTWVFFAVGTGIGATLMIDGQIFRGAHGTAPEFGHLTVVPGGRACACGKRGCLERYASGTALVDTATELAVPGVAGLGRRVVEKRGEVTGAEVMAAARVGDPTGLAVLADFAGWLGQGLAMVTDVLDPELIVVGGGVSLDADLFLGAAREGMAASIVGAGHRPLPAVGTAELGTRAGMIGVADLARGRM
ncbi:ROK family protein [Corynebacterium sp. YIM 101645]|uniref:ROK family protein n=1 Tax=Corynebacterium lemuris TaxID=1859292 RepID=A0ABT2FY08_9CORY|nr:ROK family protein [Corynebacterium lemuris]MCS5479388.1 ROK family protein [Corynebacterium lemuris]